ncbi:MAG: hypothetical protein PHR64_00330 [Candidatus Shapirobacteria bacterium]|nr:hypothetical protein [Candidatus Shapirobacteria bacterium]MDD5073653.1 hypothetical protein [Candidatus Shapirobacteria bacterium]MDD5481386.1 hypothetical protein [Candidatus Shapirobacteria bacterium]
MTRRLIRIHHRPQKLKPTRQGQKSPINHSLLLLILAWITAIGFFLTVPPQFWWQITIGLSLAFVCFFLTANITSHKTTLSLIAAGLLTILPILKIIRFLTWPIGFLIGFLIILLGAYFLLEKK